MQEFIPRPGALRYQDADGKWHYANPHDPLYSTVTMLATQYWDPGSEQWLNVLDDEADA